MRIIALLMCLMLLSCERGANDAESCSNNWIKNKLPRVYVQYDSIHMKRNDFIIDSIQGVNLGDEYLKTCFTESCFTSQSSSFNDSLKNEGYSGVIKQHDSIGKWMLGYNYFNAISYSDLNNDEMVFPGLSILTLPNFSFMDSSCSFGYSTKVYKFDFLVDNGLGEVISECLNDEHFQVFRDSFSLEMSDSTDFYVGQRFFLEDTTLLVSGVYYSWYEYWEECE